MPDTGPTHAKLHALSSALDHLKSLPLPVEGRSALEAASQNLTELVSSLNAEQQQSRLGALYRVSYTLGASLDLDEVLTQVMDAVIHLTGAERGFLVLLDAGSGAWQLRAARNLDQKTLDHRDMEVSRTVIDTVIENGQGVVTTDAQTDPRFANQDSVVFYALRSILCAPLLSRGLVIGAIYVDNRAQAGLFSENDLELMSVFAAQAAIAIENARLYTLTDQALAQRVTELETLTEVDRELSTHLELERVMEITQVWACKGTGAVRAWVLVFGEEYPDKHCLVGSQDEQPPTLDDPLILKAVDSRVVQSCLPERGRPARLVAPIWHTGASLGVMVAEAPNAFSEPAAKFLARLAARAASAIENALLYQAVQQANQAKSKFVSVVTHELRIPMTSIKGYADLLRGGAVGPVNEMQLSFLDVIRNNVERMSALVSDLSDISRIETGRLALEMKSIPVKMYVEETLRNLQSRLDERKQTLQVTFEPNLPLVQADPNRLVQVLNNLVSNANKYTPDNGIIRTVVSRQDDFVRIEVSDTGIGISEADQARLFSQFFRSEDQRVRDQQGWGLGLSVARHLVEQMGGAMDVQSRLDEGSTFWFTLPVVQE